MGRWEPDARGRLEQAAMELFEERGYARTTVEDIAARAGLTERTFFRYFTDKREVLFSGAAALEALMVETIGAAPASVAPLTAVTGAFDALAPWFESRRGHARKRRTVIAAHAELGERELIKLSTLADGDRRHSAQARSCRADRRARRRDRHRDLQECLRALG